MKWVSFGSGSFYLVLSVAVGFLAFALTMMLARHWRRSSSQSGTATKATKSSKSGPSQISKLDISPAQIAELRGMMKPGLLGIPGFSGVRLKARCGECGFDHPLEHIFKQPEPFCPWVCHNCESNQFIDFTVELWQSAVVQAMERATERTAALYSALHRPTGKGSG